MITNVTFLLLTAKQAYMTSVKEERCNRWARTMHHSTTTSLALAKPKKNPTLHYRISSIDTIPYGPFLIFEGLLKRITGANSTSDDWQDRFFNNSLTELKVAYLGYDKFRQPASWHDEITWLKRSRSNSWNSISFNPTNFDKWRIKADYFPPRSASQSKIKGDCHPRIFIRKFRSSNGPG